MHTGRIVPVYEKTGSGHAEDAAAAGVRRAAEAARGSARSAARGACASGSDCPARYAALLATHFPPADASIDALNAFATPAQRRLIFEEAFLFQMGVLARRAVRGVRAEAVRRFASTIASASRRARVLPFRLTAGQKAVAQGDRRRHAAAAADEPAAAGRRRRGQDDRRAAGGARRDGERPAGRVHGADRDPRRAALPQHLAAARSRRGSASRC